MSDIVTQACPEFYTAGGTLKPTAPSYIERAADKKLLEAVQQHKFCYILTPRQMGKSSLMVRTAKQLQKNGSRTVIIDLTSIGTTQISVEQWYLGQIYRIVTQLNLADMRTEYINWWQQQKHLSIVQRFTTFLSEVVLSKTAEPVVIFVDEIDTTLGLPKDFNTDDYFAAIRALYNDRTVNPSLERLSFVLLGVVSPSDLIKDALRTPFNIGTRIELTDFTTLKEAQSLISGLAPDRASAEQLLQQIFSFTGGHPYLTQKTCLRIAEWAKSSWNLKDATFIVEVIVKDMFLSEAGKSKDDNLQFIRKRILESKQASKLLEFYRRIRSRDTLLDSDLDSILVELKLSGLVKANSAGVLTVRNPIYERVFDESWISEALLERKPELAPGPEFFYDIYISYSTRDRNWVQGYLLPRLKAVGLNIWIDTEIRPGAIWIAEIEKAIAKSHNILVVLSPDSVASEWVLRESRTFLSLNLKDNEQHLFPLLLKPTQVPSPINRYQWIDFTRKEDWDRAMEQLLLALGVSSLQSLDKASTFPGTINKSRRYNTAVIRKLLNEAFEEDEFKAFIYDHFPSLLEQISFSGRRNTEIQKVIEYANAHGLLDQLLDDIARENPDQYRRFADQLELRE